MICPNPPSPVVCVVPPPVPWLEVAVAYDDTLIRFHYPVRAETPLSEWSGRELIWRRIAVPRVSDVVLWAAIAQDVLHTLARGVQSVEIVRHDGTPADNRAVLYCWEAP